jgi:ABC-type multidrug transport system fused ATPase/permease subunit
MMFLFVTQLTEQFNNLFQNIMGLSSQMAHLDKVKQFMESPQIPEGSYPLSEPIFSIKFDGVHFHYEVGQQVLAGIHIDLPMNRKIAFVGTSGAGKSTISHLLSQLSEPSSGTIKINGIPLESINRADWAAKYAIVSQEPYFFSDTLRTNILLGRPYTEEALVEACKLVKIHDFIESLPRGFDTEIGERGIKLSGGQRQRLALARAIIANPEILILDEATSALDVETERDVFLNLDQNRKGKTTIIIAHRLSTIKNADLIFVLEKGELVESGKHEELLRKKDVYHDLVFPLKRTI